VVFEGEKFDIFDVVQERCHFFDIILIYAQLFQRMSGSSYHVSAFPSLENTCLSNHIVRECLIWIKILFALHDHGDQVLEAAMIWARILLVSSACFSVMPGPFWPECTKTIEKQVSPR
jgi:hypothetical protein